MQQNQPKEKVRNKIISIFADKKPTLSQAEKLSLFDTFLSKYITNDEKRRKFYADRAKPDQHGYILRCIATFELYEDSNRNPAIEAARLAIHFDTMQAATALAEIAYCIATNKNMTQKDFILAKQLSDEATQLYPSKQKEHMVCFIANFLKNIHGVDFTHEEMADSVFGRNRSQS